MEKKIEDYIHLYLGCDFTYKYIDMSGEVVPHQMTMVRLSKVLEDASVQYIKPILRPLSDMTEKEFEHLFWLQMDSDQLEADCRITKEDLGIETMSRDMGGVMAEVSCRCFIGTLSIFKNGDVCLTNEDDEIQPFANQTETFRWLLSKHFDLFNLIPEGLAIDKTKINQPL